MDQAETQENSLDEETSEATTEEATEVEVVLEGEDATPDSVPMPAFKKRIN